MNAFLYVVYLDIDTNPGSEISCWSAKGSVSSLYNMQYAAPHPDLQSADLESYTHTAPHRPPFTEPNVWKTVRDEIVIFY